MFGNTQNQGAFNTGMATPNNLIANGANGIFGAKTDQQNAYNQQVGGFNQQGGNNAFGGSNNNAFGGTNAFGNGGNSAFGKPTTGNTWGQQQNNNTGFGQNQGGAFGGQNPFGQSNNATGFGANQNNPNAFGGNNQSGNAFGGNQNNPSGFGVFGKSNQNTAAFGNNSNNSAFGNQTGNNNSAFGAASSNNTSAFGANKSTFGGGSFSANNNQNGAFGGNNNNSSSFGNKTGGFGSGNTGFGGNSAFGTTNTSNSSPFGNGGTNGFSGTTTNNAFGANNANSAFGGNSSNNSFAFGNKNATTGFGGNTGVSFFGNTQNNSNTNAFGTGAFNNTSFAGNQTQNTAGFGNNSNLGGTSWGVPTGNANQGQPAKFVPLKSKNPKIDHKHLVKSIVLLDQNVNFCKNQLRINYMINGASSVNRAGNTNTSGFSFGYSGNTTSFAANTTGFGTQNTGGAFGQNNATTASFGANNNTPSFGGNSNATSFGFGQSNNTTGAFGGTGAFGQTAQGFGNQNNTTTGTGMFGASGTGMFGGSQSNGTGMFGGGQTNNSFGAASTGAFGAFSPAKPATTGATGFSLGQNTGGGFSFGSNLGNQPQAGGMFSNLGGTGGGGFFSNLGNQNTVPATSATPGFGSTGMFSGAIQASGSIFGGASTGAMFGGSNQANAGGSMFGGSSLGTTIGGALYGAMSQPQLAGGSLSPQMLNLSPYTLDEPSNPFGELLKNAEKNLGNNSRLQQLNKAFEDKYKFANTICEPGLYASPNTKRLHRDRQDIFANLNDIDLYSLGDELQRKSFRRSNTQRNIIIPNESYREPIFAKKSKLNFSKKNKIEDFKEDYERAKKQGKLEILAKEDELPQIGEFKIRPSMENLKSMTPNELKKISKVSIENKYGKVVFLNPISLYKKKMDECISIEQDSIQLIDEEWNKTKVLMVFRNFGNYAQKKGKVAERNKLEKKINKWITMQNMNKIEFNEETGDLTVELIP